MKKSFTAKLQHVMKISWAQMMLAIFLAIAGPARGGDGQVLDREITLRLSNVPLVTVLRHLEAAARIKFAYSDDQLGLDEVVTVDVKRQPLRQVLDTLLTPHQISYKVHEKERLITLRKITKDDRRGADEKARGSAADIFSVSGSVTDGSTGQPMPGVNVLVKGTTSGTNTDSQGAYVLNADANSVLVFSFIGYKTIEEAVGSRIVIDVVLQEDIETLKEVEVNAGYWKVTEKERTGNISRVTAEQIQHQPVSNPMAAIQGRMAGVLVTEDSGIPGSGFRVQIRGQNSLRADGNDPLYIIDGVPYTANTFLQTNPTYILRRPSPLSILNPADIESIEVLKDADATAIYGSRGANGVILITTKKGKAGKTQLEGNVYAGVGMVPHKVKLLNTPEYLAMRQEAFASDGTTPGDFDYDVNGVWDQTRYTDWQETLIGGTANFTNAQLSLTGGSDRTRFLVGGGFNRQTTVFPGDFSYLRGSGHFNLNHTSENGKLSISLTSSFGSESNNMIDAQFTSAMYDLPPNAPALYDDQGNLNWENGTWTNPLGDLEKDYEAKTNNLITNMVIGYEVLPGLHAKASIGYNLLHVRETKLNPIRAKNPASSPPPLGSAVFADASGNNWIAEPQLQYEKTIGKGRLTALAGGTFQENVEERSSINTTGIDNDALLKSVAAAPKSGVTVVNSYSQYKYTAAFGRFNFAWNEKYIINLTARRDGSSRFGPGKQFANFGAVGAAWIFSNEKFIKQAFPFLTFGKLRSSYGTTGSDQIGNYGYLDSYQSTTRQYSGTGLVPSRLANPDFGWETNNKWEIGLDLGFMQDRLFLGASYYHNRSSNQLVGLPLAGTTGFTTVQYNLDATVQNTGLEIELNYSTDKSHPFRWSERMNFSLPSNQLVEYPGLDASSYANQYRIGEPLSIALCYRFTGVDPQTGVYAFADLNGDGYIQQPDDSQEIVRMGVRYYGGLQNTFDYKGFQLDFLLQYVDMTRSTYRTEYVTPGLMGNQPVEVLDHWRQEGDHIKIQKLTAESYGTISSAHDNWLFSDDAVTDGSFLRLKNISLSWNVPVAAISKIRLQALAVYMQAQNLVTITNFKGMDPEGADASVPPLRVITAGLRIGL